MVVLGLDASTRTVGFAFTKDGKILDTGFYDISDISGNRDKAHYVVNKLKINPLTEKVEQVNLEAALSGFSGPSNRAVVIKLMRFNAVLEYVLQDNFPKVILIGAQTARKQVLGAARIDGMKPKEFVRMKFEKMFDLSEFEVKNKRGTPDKRMEDVRDACVMSLYVPPS